MKRSTRHATETQTLVFSAFNGGLNLRAAPENIDDNQLSDCNNMTYSSQPGRLRTREGVGAPLYSFAEPISGMHWYKGTLMIVCGQKLYKWDLDAMTEHGATTGREAPSWCEFGDDLFFATGGKIQKWNGETLTTIDESPASVIGIYARAGRLFCWESDNDTLHGSGVGDGSKWTVPVAQTDADPCDTQIGYKVAGNIVACVPSLTDVIVFKDTAAFRLIGEYPEWSIKEISRDEGVANQHSAVNVAGYLFYLDKKKGARLLQGTDGYEEVAPGDAMINVNPWIRANIDPSQCRMWHLKARNIVMVGAGESAILPSFYEFGIAQMPSLKWTFYGSIKDIVEVDKITLFIAIGTALHLMSPDSVLDWDPVEQGTVTVPCYFSTKTYLPLTDYLVKRIMVAGVALDDLYDEDPVDISIDDREVLQMHFEVTGAPYIYDVSRNLYDNDDDLFSSTATETVFEMHNPVRLDDLSLTVDGSDCPFELSRITLELVAIGVNT